MQNPCLTEANYKEMEAKVKAVFDSAFGADPELKGNYYPLLGMTKEVQNQLIADHFLFKEGDRCVVSSALRTNPLQLPARGECVPLLAGRSWHLPQRQEDVPGEREGVVNV